MATTASYILITLAVLAFTAFIEFLVNPGKKSVRLSPMSALAFAFVVSGAFFSEKQWLGYSLMGIGVLLAIIDIIRKYRRSKLIE